MTEVLFRLAGPIIAVVLMAGCSEQEPESEASARPVRAMRVGDVAELGRREFPGRAEAAQEVDLSFRVAGPLIELPVKVGARVAAGDMLARIDPRDFEVRQRKAQGELDRVIANRQRARNEYDRLLGIQKRDRNLVAEFQVDRAKENYELAKADITAFEASLDAASDAVAYARLKAPFDGMVVATFVENFEYVQARQSVLRILDSTRIQFEFNVPETMTTLAQQVQNLRVRFDAFPDVEVPAEIAEIGFEASATTRTYPITLIMDQPQGAKILPGMAGKVTGDAPSKTGDGAPSLFIPLNAVYSPESGDRSYVWVIDEAANTVQQREVQLGRLDVSGVAVMKGLASGEVIATAGVSFLSEGQQVRPELE